MASGEVGKKEKDITPHLSQLTLCHLLHKGEGSLMEKRLVYLILGVLFYEIKDNINGDCIDFRL